MSVPRKRFEDHSARWQREAKRDGISPSRWNRWLKLSQETKKATSAIDYAKGVSIAQQKRGKGEAVAIARMLSLSGRNARLSTIRRNVGRMSNEDLRFVANATERQLRRRAAAGGTDNLFWYH